MKITFNLSSSIQILKHLRDTDHSFVPELSSRVDLEVYTKKIFEKSFRIEAWDGKCLIGLIAVYLNFDKKKAFITNLSVSPSFIGNGSAQLLLNKCTDYLREKKIAILELEVDEYNTRAMNFYFKNGFKIFKNQARTICLSLNLKKDEERL